MKLVKIIIAVVLTGMTIYGWMTVGTEYFSSDAAYNEIIGHAEKAFEVGLYQDAYNSYVEAEKLKPSEELTRKQVEAFSLYYEHDSPDDYNTRNELIDILDKARLSYPQTASYALDEINLYIDNQDLELAKRVCEQALESNSENKELLSIRNDIIRSFYLGYEYCAEYRQSDAAYWAVFNGAEWKVSIIGTDKKFQSDLENCGAVSTGGVYLAKEPEKAARFYDLDNVAIGITKEDYLSYGIYQEGLCPVQRSETEWTYIDLMGEEKVGNFRYAGTFLNGKAAVQRSDGQWALIDQEGKTVSKNTYSNIKLNINGEWASNGIMIAAKAENQYILLNQSEERIGDFQCTNIDIPGNTGLYAFEQEGKWGFVSCEGIVVIRPTYDQAQSFQNGLAGVCVDGQWGFINTENEEVVECQFLDVGYVSAQGCVMVSDEDALYRVLTFYFLQEVSA